MGNRICVNIDNDLYKKLRVCQAQFIKKNNKSISFSKVLNNILRDKIIK